MATAKFTIEQRVFVVNHWVKYDHDYASLVLDFEDKFPNTRVPERGYAQRLYRKFLTTGTVNDKPRSGRPKTAFTDENLETVAFHFTEHPRTSQRHSARQLQMKRSSLQRLMKAVQFKPYRPRVLQQLSEDDFDRRLEFCELFLARLAVEPDLPERILWTDEAQFKINGLVNRHNSVYWSTDNPRIIVTQELNSPGIHVWAGICHRGIIGPYFMHETMNADRYCDMLMEVVLPELQNSPAFQPWNNLIWQQDGAPAHYALRSRALLDEHFNEWIGRRGTWEWPARTCDMTCMDFAVWGMIREKVYVTRPENLDHLQNLIENAFTELNQDRRLISRICYSVTTRVNSCYDVNGSHFEHYKT